MSGPFGSTPHNLFNTTASDFYNGVINQSLRFEEGGTHYLDFTPAQDGTDNKRYTISVWLKLAQESSDFRTVFSSKNAGSGTGQGHNTYAFGTDDQFETYTENGANNPYTTALYRDRGSWYNFVIAYDTTQSTASDRIKIYVNGSRDTTLGGSSFPGENSVMSSVNTNGRSQQIGKYVPGYTRYFNGYMADFHMIDGQALDASYFGETKNGIWIPIAYADNGVTSHGINGYHLTFQGTGTSTTSQGTTAQTNIGDDQSGNGNNFAVYNLAAGDIVPDTPEGNFATANNLAVNTSSPWTTSEGNLKILSSSNNKNIRGSFLMQSGKWYWETRRHNANNGSGQLSDGVGISLASGNIEDNPYQSATNWSYYSFNGNKYNNNSSSSYGDSWNTAGDIIGVAFDADNGAIWFSKNGTWQNSATASEIAAGTTTNAAYTGLTDSEGYVCNWWRTGGTNAEELDLNFGQNPSFNAELTGGDVGTESGDGNALFKYAPPTGFKALTTSNMPDITIGPNSTEQADDNFNTVLYTGDGTTSRSITGVGFTPDWIWGKSRSNAEDHFLHDTVRGAGKKLESNNTGAEDTTATAVISAFESDGFTGPASTPGNINVNTRTYVTWNWKAGGSASSNSDGSNITSSVSANTAAGFSIVAYTGTGTGSHTVGHGLTQKPDLVIVKNRDADSSPNYWHVNHKDLTASDYNIFLNLTSAESDVNTNYAEGGIGLGDANVIDFVAGYSGANNVANCNKSGSDYIAYCFHGVEGYSKVGSYKGNNNADGPHVNTGFRPAWIMTKRTDTTSNWLIIDVKRDIDNVAHNRLIPNLSNTEATSVAATMDILSNGFKRRHTNTDVNANGGDYIYLAFAEAPFKFANAR